MCQAGVSKGSWRREAEDPLGQGRAPGCGRVMATARELAPRSLPAFQRPRDELQKIDQHSMMRGRSLANYLPISFLKKKKEVLRSYVIRMEYFPRKPLMTIDETNYMKNLVSGPCCQILLIIGQSGKYKGPVRRAAGKAPEGGHRPGLTCRIADSNQGSSSGGFK